MKYVYKKKILVFFAAILDFLGMIVSFPFKIFNPPKLPNKISKILLIRLDHVGDIIMSTVVLKPLKEAFPDAEIDFVAPSWGSDFVKNNPYINRVIEFNPVWFNRKSAAGILNQIKDAIALTGIVKKGGYDVAIDLRGDLRHILTLFFSGIRCRISYGITGGGFLLTHEVSRRAGVHETEHNMDLVRVLGVSSERPEVSFSLSSETEKSANGVLVGNNISGTYAVFHVVPGHPTKFWEEEKFSKVIDYASEEKNISAVLVGAGEDTRVMKDIILQASRKVFDLSGKTDWDALAGVLKKASFFVGVDSAPAHIAAALGIPTVILFSGVNDPAQWAPKGENVRIIYPGRGKDLSEVKPEEVCRVIDEMVA